MSHRDSQQQHRRHGSASAGDDQRDRSHARHDRRGSYPSRSAPSSDRRSQSQTSRPWCERESSTPTYRKQQASTNASKDNVEQRSRTPTDLELDFCSELFNPEKALRTRNIRVPIPQMPAVDNLAKWHYMVMVDPKIKKQNADRKKAKEAEAKRLRDLQEKHPAFKQKAKDGANPKPLTPATEPMPSKHKKKLPASAMNILQHMEADEKGDRGHMTMLSRCVKNRTEVQVLVRHLRGIRGTCIGRLIAYDKHLNLVRYNSMYSRLRSSLSNTTTDTL